MPDPDGAAETPKPRPRLTRPVVSPLLPTAVESENDADETRETTTEGAQR
jgi:hypothetical protein